ncbi:hypothetical protein Bca52824_021816 [Brassica carinata]|uniref:Uncharacterized protein n=1 Tax=Brassica carinata TaxID=52824 RepID=A0A8X7VF88_BRACI|nr:hypothetical protein Bca52824_021816 [Brassica carinata]
MLIGSSLSLCSGNDFALILGVDDNGDVYKVLKEGVVVYRGVMDSFNKLNDEFMTRGNDFALIVRVDDNGDGYKVCSQLYSMSHITRWHVYDAFHTILQVPKEGVEVYRGIMDSFNKLNDQFMTRSAWGIKCASDGQSSYLGQQNRDSKLVTVESKSTRKHYVGKLADELEREGGFTVIRTLPYDEISLRLSRRLDRI